MANHRLEPVAPNAATLESLRGGVVRQSEIIA
jgi:hypothetical protein